MFYQNDGNPNNKGEEQEDDEKEKNKDKKEDKFGDELIENVKLLSEKYQKVYINKERFEVIDDLDKLYQECKEGCKPTDKKENNPNNNNNNKK